MRTRNYCSFVLRTDNAAGPDRVHIDLQGRDRREAASRFPTPAARLHVPLRLLVPALRHRLRGLPTSRRQRHLPLHPQDAARVAHQALGRPGDVGQTTDARASVQLPAILPALSPAPASLHQLQQHPRTHQLSIPGPAPVLLQQRTRSPGVAVQRAQEPVFAHELAERPGQFLRLSAAAADDQLPVRGPRQLAEFPAGFDGQHGVHDGRRGLLAGALRRLLAERCERARVRHLRLGPAAAVEGAKHRLDQLEERRQQRERPKGLRQRRVTKDYARVIAELSIYTERRVTCAKVITPLKRK